MSDDVIISLIGTVIGPVIILWVSTRLGRRIKMQGIATEQIRYQVENSHKTNIRDDMDVILTEVQAGFTNVRGEISSVRGDLAGVHGDIRGLREDVTELRKTDSQNSREISELQKSVAQIPA